MMIRLALCSIVVLFAVAALDGTAAAQSAPDFRLGFRLLADQIPEIVGQPLENEHWGANGDSLQQTTKGLMAWRKADNWTAFTNGSRTWVNGPAGVQERGNNERFPWEETLAPSSTATSIPLPTQQPVRSVPPPTPTPPSPRYYIPDVKAMDATAGGHGVTIIKLVAEVDAEWARVWGWRPSKPTMVYLYTDGNSMANDLSGIFGRALSAKEWQNYATNIAGLSTSDRRTGGWAVTMNLSYGMGSADWEPTMMAVLVHEYAHVMQADVASGAGPTWFLEGMAELGSFSKVPGSPYMVNRMQWLAEGKRRGTLPTISALDRDWYGIAGRSPDMAVQAYAVAYTGIQLLADRVGGSPLLEVLRRTKAGTDFNATLQAVTGYSVASLDTAVQVKLAQ